MRTDPWQVTAQEDILRVLFAIDHTNGDQTFSTPWQSIIRF